MARNITVGIDVGSFATKVVVVETAGREAPKIIGTGVSESKGIRQGYITSIEEVAKAIKKAAGEAEKSAGVKIRRAVLAIGGISVTSEITNGTAIISRADKEVTDLDVKRAISESEDLVSVVNKRILHIIPLGYKLDNQEVLGRPEGMKGIKLEVKTLFVACLEQHVDDLVTALRKADIEAIDVIAAPLALAMLTLSPKERQVGSVLIDIGAETVSAAVFENNTLSALHVFAIGSSDITKDVALGFKITLEEAESLKLGRVMADYPKKRLDNMVLARFEDIFELVEDYLKKIGRSGLLPAGAILAGGGANYPAVKEIAKRILKLPVEIGTIKLEVTKKVINPALYVAAGLAFSNTGDTREPNSGTMKNIKKSFRSLLDQILP
ncbi:MAG TPA: cell division protein FtsA [Candidatus Paceibacterota bacterium]|nr:cell division protein FtsA [Candidatus Paceibacterota bacterium]